MWMRMCTTSTDAAPSTGGEGGSGTRRSPRGTRSQTAAVMKQEDCAGSATPTSPADTNGELQQPKMRRHSSLFRFKPLERPDPVTSSVSSSASVASAAVGASTSHTSPGGDEPIQPQKVKKRRGRPPNNASNLAGSPMPTEMDVLYAKGAAAQTTTNPGNILFYRLCEEGYDEWAKLEDRDPDRRAIIEGIVDAIASKGGVFRTANGGVLPRAKSIEKTKDRMRQIGKPKLRPQGFGEDDVVFARGAAIHLYPGNAKWHVLVDGYVRSYFRNVLNGTDAAAAKQLKRGKKGKFAKGTGNMKARPQYQHEIVKEITEIIQHRGGKFKDEQGNEMSLKEIDRRTHQRFKDLKKDLVSGARTFEPRAVVKEEETSDDPCIMCTDQLVTTDDKAKEDFVDKHATVGAEIFRNRSGGFTSVKNVVSSISELKDWKMKNRKQKKPRASRRIRRQNDSDDDEASFQSEMLCSESDSDSSDDEAKDDVNSDWEDTMVKRTNIRQQNNDREERLKRRRSGIVKVQQPAKKPRKKRRQEPEVQEELPPDLPLSEYEMYRLEKIRRNHAKLAELGLLNSKGGKRK